jgi:hypothetical protein
LTSGSGFSSEPVTFAPDPAGVTLYVRFAPTGWGRAFGWIELSAPELATFRVPVEGTTPRDPDDDNGCLAGNGTSLWVLALLAAGVGVSRRRGWIARRPE